MPKYRSTRKANLKQHSVATRFDEYRKEWIFEGKSKPGPSTCELCEKNDIITAFAIRNERNNETLWVDKKCIIQLNIPGRVSKHDKLLMGTQLKEYLYKSESYNILKRKYPAFIQLVRLIPENLMKRYWDRWLLDRKLALSLDEVIDLVRELHRLNSPLVSTDLSNWPVADLTWKDLLAIQDIDPEIWNDTRPIISKSVNKLLNQLKRNGGKVAMPE